MARGNDPDREAEFQQQYGTASNAEQLLRQHRAANPTELRQASRKPVDNAATEALDLGSLKGPNGEEVVSAAVRGGKTIVVYLDDETQTLHRALADTPRSAKRAAKDEESSESQRGKGQAEKGGSGTQAAAKAQDK